MTRGAPSGLRYVQNIDVQSEAVFEQAGKRITLKVVDPSSPMLLLF